MADNMAMNATNSSIEQYSPTEPLDFVANRGADLVNQIMFPLIVNSETNEKPISNEKSLTQFSCKAIDCNKTYASISGLNNHIKK